MLPDIVGTEICVGGTGSFRGWISIKKLKTHFGTFMHHILNNCISPNVKVFLWRYARLCLTVVIVSFKFPVYKCYNCMHIHYVLSHHLFTTSSGSISLLHAAAQHRVRRVLHAELWVCFSSPWEWMPEDVCFSELCVRAVSWDLALTGSLKDWVDIPFKKVQCEQPFAQYKSQIKTILIKSLPKLLFRLYM